jgi:ferredoxin-NADP reductase
MEIDERAAGKLSGEQRPLQTGTRARINITASLNESFEFQICSRGIQMPFSTDNTQAQILATVMTYPSKLIGRTDVARGTVAFHFERPRNFVFRAGQSVDLSLPAVAQDPPHRLTHTFSIASDPSDEEIMVATRMRDTAFKQRLSQLPIETEIRIEGPMGSFTLHNNTTRPAVLLAGGIGIAPFLSMVSHARTKGLHHRIILFYANRQLEDAAFIDALWNLERMNARFSFVPTLTCVNGSNGEWKGETGHISLEMLHRRVGKLQGPIFYIAGPPAMVAATRRTLLEAAVDEDDIRTEEFAGY